MVGWCSEQYHDDTLGGRVVLGIRRIMTTSVVSTN